MYKIAVIEDDHTVRTEIAELLEKHGYEVAIINDFAHGADKTLKEEVNLVLLDINLPVCDGYYICREIRKASNMPIIVIVNKDNNINELKNMNLGTEDFVIKPINSQNLLALISTILNRI